MPESSSSKRRTIENPFIKPENRGWSIVEPASLKRPVSPPASTPKEQRRNKHVASVLSADEIVPKSAAVEAGESIVTHQLTFWSIKLEVFERPHLHDVSRLSISQWKALYLKHAESTSGSHFVVHQHDHPVAGTHYDLRLQCNPTSSISFAIMYGLPGNPNSRRLNRNATETRVHCLWNHLIETASLSTGSMLIWDTGHYEVLPFKEEKTTHETEDDSDSYNSTKTSKADHMTEQQKLHVAFGSRKIRLRLHRTRLSGGYTISLRLTKENYRSEQPGPPSRKRKANAPITTRKMLRRSTTSDSGSDSDTPSDMGPFGGGRMKRSLSSLLRQETPPPRGGKHGNTSTPPLISGDADPGSSDHEAEDQEEIRKNNAYPGATNDIGSIHQRKWYLSMDRRKSGFVSSRSKDGSREWIRKRSEDGDLGGFECFNVLGRDAERSVVTGRLAKDILEDEGVEGFVPRGLWKGVTE